MHWFIFANTVYNPIVYYCKSQFLHIFSYVKHNQISHINSFLRDFYIGQCHNIMN